MTTFIMKKYTSLVLLLFPLLLQAQSSHLPLGNDAYHTMDRLEIKSGELMPAHTLLKPFDRRDVANFAIQMDTSQMRFGKLDSLDMRYIFRDNNDWVSNEIISKWYAGKEYVDEDSVFYRPVIVQEKGKGYYEESRKPFLKYFYHTPANLFEINQPNFKLKINPIFYARYGQETGDTSYVYLNRRGFSLRGSIDDVVWFHTNLYESQERFQQHVMGRIAQDSLPAIPGAGFYKDFETDLWNTDGYDYLRGQGYIAARVSKHINAHFGHGRHFIGDGMRSLFLSDFANDYFYLKINTRVWKLHYQNLYAELTSQHRQAGDRILPKKYIAAHHLSFNNILPNLNFGIYESIIFDRRNTFELQYLNPIIIYRTVEQAVGSPDNVVAGMNFKYNFLKRFSLYGQAVFDEFVFGELFSGNGWWANKTGVQLGLKYIDVLGVSHLDGQIEYNTVRPYTYTYDDVPLSYTHYNQPLAHPLGANFREIIGKIRYQPIHPLTLQARVVYADFGTDNPGENVGHNLFANYLDRTTPEGSDNDESGHQTGQGVSNQLLIGQLTASYQFRHNVYLDADYIYRNRTSEDPALEYTRNYIGLSLRVNIAANTVDY